MNLADFITYSRWISLIYLLLTMNLANLSFTHDESRWFIFTHDESRWFIFYSRRWISLIYLVCIQIQTTTVWSARRRCRCFCSRLGRLRSVWRRRSRRCSISRPRTCVLIYNIFHHIPNLIDKTHARLHQSLTPVTRSSKIFLITTQAFFYHASHRLPSPASRHQHTPCAQLYHMLGDISNWFLMHSCFSPALQTTFAVPLVFLQEAGQARGRGVLSQAGRRHLLHSCRLYCRYASFIHIIPR